MIQAARRGFVDRLGVRLGLVIGLALLPVGLMAVFQTTDLLAEAQARSEAALAGETLRAVRPKLAVIKRAQGVAEALASLGPAAGCSGLEPLMAGGNYVFGGYYGTDGMGVCLSHGAPLTFQGTEALAAILTGSTPALSVLRGSGETAALVTLHPEVDAGGTVTGFVAVSPRDGSLDADGTDGPDLQGFSLFVFDRTGEVLSFTAAADQAASFLPAGRRLGDLSTADVATFTAPSEGGKGRVYSLVQLVEGELFALGTWPEERPGLAAMKALPPLLFPALMWSMSLIAAWFAAELLVAQHIRRLRSAIMDFAGGNRTVRPLDLRKAPREIREAGEAFGRMTDAILRDEAELEDMLREKEVLLREVHHRVKNNLQFIASIINMQLRHTRSDEARGIMRGLQERMMSLATVHNGLYQTADLSVIGAETLLPGIVDQVMRNAEVRGLRVALESHLEPVALTVDQAVPLALLMTEGLANALKHASTEDGSPPRVTVSFVQGKPGEGLLEVTNSATGLTSAVETGDSGTGIGTQLLRGFAKQLNGELVREFAGGMCQLRVWFPLSPRAEAAA